MRAGVAYAECEDGTEVYDFPDYQAHYEEHGREFDFAGPEEYRSKAQAIASGDQPGVQSCTFTSDRMKQAYWYEGSQSIVVVYADVIRTFFVPGPGHAYFDQVCNGG